jgi:hypothetical protein
MRGYQPACDRTCSAISSIDPETIVEQLRESIFS